MYLIIILFSQIYQSVLLSCLNEYNMERNIYILLLLSYSIPKVLTIGVLNIKNKIMCYKCFPRNSLSSYSLSTYKQVNYHGRRDEFTCWILCWNAEFHQSEQPAFIQLVHAKRINTSSHGCYHQKVYKFTFLKKCFKDFMYF